MNDSSKSKLACYKNLLLFLVSSSLFILKVFIWLYLIGFKNLNITKNNVLIMLQSHPVKKKRDTSGKNAAKQK